MGAVFQSGGRRGLCDVTNDGGGDECIAAHVSVVVHIESEVWVAKVNPSIFGLGRLVVFLSSRLLPRPSPIKFMYGHVSQGADDLHVQIDPPTGHSISILNSNSDL